MTRFFVFFLLFIAANASAALRDKPNLDQRFPDRLLVPDYHGGLEPGRDLPANLVSAFAEERLQKVWSDFLQRVQEERNLNNDRTYGRDWEALRDLNLEAARLWKELVDCSAGDAEKARDAYLKVEATGCADETLQKIAIYRENIKQFLHTTLIEDPRGPGLMLGEADSKYVPQATQPFVAMPIVHPLFSQVVLEHAMTIIRFNWEKYYGEERNSVYMRQGGHQFAQMLLYLTHRAPKITVEMYQLDKYPPHAFNEARATLNVLLLLETLPAMDCAEWGLWPAAAQGVVEWMKFSFTELCMSADFGIYPTPLSRMGDRVKESCGEEKIGSRMVMIEHSNKRGLDLRYKYFSYREWGKYFVLQYKDISVRYEKKLKSLNKEKDKTEGKSCFLGIFCG